MNFLYLIPARGGSKGLPGKNIMPLGGKPLIEYSVEMARKFSKDDHICVSTDSQEIANIVENIGLKVPFLRPYALSSDTANSRDVILHALDFQRNQYSLQYDAVILLQPTSPFRKEAHLRDMLKAYSREIDMVVSVKESHDNPYFSLFEENNDGFLRISKPSNITRRQDAPKVFAFNGSVYIINAESIRKNKIGEFNYIKKFVMDDIHSMDIDTEFDWQVAEMIFDKSLMDRA